MSFTALKSLEEAEKFLLGYSPKEIKGRRYTLDRMQRVMELLDNPQNDVKVVHIAGTSGKTSTAYFVRALLEQAGMKTGLTASPHVASITERVQIHGQPLAEATFLQYLNEFLKEIAAWHELNMSYFELLIAFAYWVFRREKVDYAVVEVGLGGKLDATNVISRSDKLCILSSIGLDHTDILGDTIEKIAAQKAGIIHRGNAVISTYQPPSVEKIFQQVSEQHGAVIQFLSRHSSDQQADLPEYQQQNWQLGHAAFRYLQSRDGLTQLAVGKLKIAAQQTPPGRFEQYSIGNTTVILDGAHNPQKLQALTSSLPKEAYNALWLIAIAEAPEGKIENCLKVISASTSRIIATEFMVGQDLKVRRAVAADKLAVVAKAYGIQTVIHAEAKIALEEALHSGSKYVVITGSLFLVALLRPELQRLARQRSYRPPAK